MKKTLWIAVGLLFVAATIKLVFAQRENHPHEGMDVASCVTMIRSLQQGDSIARTDALAALKADNTWTLLDEIGDYRVDEVREYLPLGLNDVAYEAVSARLDDYGSPQGVFVDGRDPLYAISFIEKCLAPASEVEYTLTDRVGLQRIAVVEMQEEDLTVEVDGQTVIAEDGVFVAESRKEEITIRLRNRRGYTINFVIINEHL